MPHTGPCPRNTGSLFRTPVLFLGLALALLVPAGIGSAGSGAAAEAASGSAPSRIFLGLTADPGHELAVTWRSARPVEHPVGQIALLTAAPDFGEQAGTVEAQSRLLDLEGPGVPEGSAAFHHTVVFRGLEPSTRYCYRVGDGTVWSEWSVFRTAATQPQPFRFLFLGDVQNRIHSHCSRLVRTACLQAPDARFLLLAGDVVNEGYDDAQWGEWSDALGFLSAMIPTLCTVGNHDTERWPEPTGHDTPFTAAPPYHAHFRLPQNGPAGQDLLDQESFYLDYQGVRIISVNANVYAYGPPANEAHRQAWDAQLRWLEGLLRQNPNRWTIVTHHQPVYSVSKGRDNEDLRRVLRPLYDAYRVDLVLQGHDHCYGRTHQVKGDEIAGPGAPGTVYVVSVAGPKQYEPAPKFSRLMARTCSDQQLYQIVAVDRDTLALETRALDGRRIDAFRLVKDAAGTTRLEDE